MSWLLDAGVVWVAATLVAVAVLVAIFTAEERADRRFFQAEVERLLADIFEVRR